MLVVTTRHSWWYWTLGKCRPVTILLVCQIVLTTLSIVFGLEIRGEIIRGYPCIKRLNQLYCPTPGNTYPKFLTVATNSNYTEYIDTDGVKRSRRVKREKIDMFIDENKALIRRMFGEYNVSPEENVASSYPRDHYETYDGHTVHTRSERSRSSSSYSTSSNKVDACESAVEIVTPYWASNSAGKIRAIVNTQHLQQAIQQEVCQSVQTKKCNNDCSCEQKYKWHRLLAYDPDDDCKGIFMDWFLFPSCCVCRCANPITK